MSITSADAASSQPALRGIRSAQIGVVVNAILALAKIVAGIVGSTYALVADGIESLADIASSLIVWGGLSIAAQPPDENHPFGHGKAEALTAATVSLMLLGAAVGIAIQSVLEIRRPHLQESASHSSAAACGAVPAGSRPTTGRRWSPRQLSLTMA